MDPQANIVEQVRLSRALLAAADADEDIDEGDALRLAELVLALAGWLGRGGGFASDWAAALAEAEA